MYVRTIVFCKYGKLKAENNIAKFIENLLITRSSSLQNPRQSL
jgi:hypothetical protein